MNGQTWLVAAMAALVVGCAVGPVEPAGAADTQTAATGALDAEEAAFQARAARLIKATAGQDGLRERWTTMGRKREWDCHKYLWPICLARLQMDPKDAIALGLVKEFNVTQGHYHFATIGSVRLHRQFGHLFDEETREAHLASAIGGHKGGGAREAALFNGSGTENHLNMWRTSAYLLAEEGGDAKRTAAMKEWLKKYVKRLYTHGSGEWDSSTYYAFNMIGFMNLYDFAKDPEVKTTAKQALDWLTATYAIKYADGLCAGPEKRGNAREPYGAITDYFMWLWVGDDFAPGVPRMSEAQLGKNSAIYAVHAALSTYRPDPAVLGLARKQGTAFAGPVVVKATKPDYEQSTAGRDHETLYIHPQFVLGSVLTPVGGYIGGDNQLTTWKLAVRGTKESPAPVVLIGGQPFSGGRSPWDQLAQRENVLILMTKVPADAEAHYEEVKKTIAQWKKDVWPNVNVIDKPDYSNVCQLKAAGEMAFAEVGGRFEATVRGVRIVAHPIGKATVGEGGKGPVLSASAPAGQLCGFVLEILADADAKPGTVELVEGDKVLFTAAGGGTLAATFNSSPTGGVEDRFNRTAVRDEPTPLFPGIGGRVATIRIDGEVVDGPATKTPAPVYSSPVLTLKDGVLEVNVDGKRMRVEGGR